MCLAIPSKIIGINDGMGTIDVDGVRRSCSLLLLENAKVGDWVVTPRIGKPVEINALLAYADRMCQTIRQMCG